MNTLTIRVVFGLIISFFFVSGFAVNEVNAQTCFLSIEKSAPQDKTQEFVFTADAVRGIGGGDVEKGAEKLYGVMKQAEKVGRA